MGQHHFVLSQVLVSGSVLLKEIGQEQAILLTRRHLRPALVAFSAQLSLKLSTSTAWQLLYDTSLLHHHKSLDFYNGNPHITLKALVGRSVIELYSVFAVLGLVSSVWVRKMSYLGIGVSPGTVPVYHGSNVRVIDRRVKVAELVLRFVICGFSALAAALVATDSQVMEIFTIRKKAKYTDMKALVFLVVVNGIAAAYSLIQGLRCVVSMVSGRVLFSRPLAWAIFSCDQLMSYLCVAAMATAAQSAALAKLGEPELQWMKICNMYGKFCNQVGGGLASALVASLGMVVLSCISAFSFFRLCGRNKSLRKW